MLKEITERNNRFTYYKYIFHLIDVLLLKNIIYKRLKINIYINIIQIIMCTLQTKLQQITIINKLILKY